MRMRYLLLAYLTCGLCAAQEQQHPPVVQEPTNASLPANLPAQPIGANDLLMISVYDAPELSHSVRVGADGEIRLPMLKQRIKAEDLLPAELENSIAQALIDEGILVDPIVTVGIAEYHSRPISVAGAVRNPVTFQAAGPVTLLEAIAKAGGLEKTAGEEILLTRAETQDGKLATTTLHIPVKSLIDSADPRWNLQLVGGEDIRVPEAGQIFVVGNVKKPGAFSAPEATDATVLKAVALAEGLLPFSSKQAFIYRPDPTTRVKQEIPINLTQILNRKTPDVPLQPEDILYIPENKQGRLSVAALEKLLVFGSGTTSALIYAGVH
jgi:polysaccharide biosynthesis/export protein